MKLARGIILLVLWGCTFPNAFAQSQQQKKTDSVFRLIRYHIQTRDADAIYDLADIRFQRTITQGNFRDFLFRELFSLGHIKRDSLISFVNNLTAAYKIQFDAVTMQLSLSLSDAGKLAYFKLEPYKQGTANKPSLVASANPLKSQTDKIVDSVARLYIQRSNTVGLSLGVLKNGKVSTYNYGETKLGSHQLPTSSTLFEIGSITKTFTATLLAWYVNAGKLKLTDHISQYLPDSVATNLSLKDITLVELSNHTSGLPSLPTNFAAQVDYTDANPYQNYNRQLLFSYLKKCTLKSEPGKQYAYSNLAVGLLGIILEHVTGKPYEQLVSDIICKPLGMKNTVQHLYPMLATRFTTVYDEDGHQTPAWDFNALAACGSLRSTVNDLMIYTRANMTKTNTELSKAFELAHQITYTHEPKVGLGWHIIKVAAVDYYFHNGGTEGSSSFLAYNAEKGLAVIILSNSGASTDNTGFGILKRLN